jgi:1-acyl-sn-glycerol-3-phosphate acyltransferase
MKTQPTYVWRALRTLVRPLAVLLFDLKVYGTNNIPATGGVLIVSNHQSYLDPILLPLQLERPLNYIAKSELFSNPLAAWFLRSILNAFPVRQGHTDVRAVKETIHRLQEGHLMNIYPEGARTADGKIAPLQRGVGLIVERAGAAVVPAVIVGAFEAWPLQRKFPRRRPVCIQFGPPLDLSGLGRDEILEKIDHTLRSMFEALQTRSALDGRRAA